MQITPFVPSLCIAEPLTGVLRPRNYAILLFGREPQRFIPGAFAIYSTYPGRDRTDPVARRFEIAGTLLDQARRLQELLDAEAVTLFDKTNLKSPNAEKYPRRALQEAMVNALAHRDYELVDPSRFISYADRIEFVSPGALPFGVALEDLRTRAVTPRWRNQSLAWFLSRVQLAQAEGQGIQTIRSTMKAVGCPPPRFDASEVSVSCVLRAHPRSRALGLTAVRERAPRKSPSKVRKKAGKTRASKKAGKRGENTRTTRNTRNALEGTPHQPMAAAVKTLDALRLARSSRAPHVPCRRCRLRPTCASSRRPRRNQLRRLRFGSVRQSP